MRWRNNKFYINFFVLFWIFVAASILGYVFEMAFCLIKHGVIQSRQGLLYGPFCQVYGFGAVLAAILIVPIANKGSGWVFTVSAFVGGLFEYICSYIQEILFGTVSWNYGQRLLSINGRTSLLYMFFWGAIGLAFIKLYPSVAGFLIHVPKRQGWLLTWIMIFVLSVNALISAAAVYRWANRQNGVPAFNVYDEFLDEQYPDEFLKEVYPNMINVNFIRQKGGF